MTDAERTAQANVDRMNLGGTVAHVTEHHADPAQHGLQRAPANDRGMSARTPWQCFPTPAAWRSWWAFREQSKDPSVIPCDDCLLERARAERAAGRCALPSTLTPGHVPYWAREAITRFALAVAHYKKPVESC